jgi:sulfide dehydrogenase [flavocytochrome c] flavoprotein subunit
MGTINRRDFVKLAGAATALGTIGFPMVGFGAAKARVIVVGGGYAGAIAAKYTKMYVPDADVMLIERKKEYISHPFSNEVIGGERDIKSLTFTYAGLEKRGVECINDEVVEIDIVAKTLKTKSGKSLKADYLVVAPGIEIKWGAIEGYGQAAAELAPHAWEAGPQTLLLKKQVDACPDGGLIIISAPPNPFRCPPGPYERAAQIAFNLKHHGKNKAKILILDAKEAFSKQALFMEGWKHNYGDMIEWLGASAGGKVESIDAKTLTVKTEFEEYKADVLNVIPPHKTGLIAEKVGLTDEKGWCPVNQATFESKKAPGVYVVGDASIAGAMPKSGYAANTQAKIAAANIAGAILGMKIAKPALTNTCYSLLAPDYGISVAGVYMVGPDGVIVDVPGSGGISTVGAPLEARKREAVYGVSWYDNIVSDAFT